MIKGKVGRGRPSTPIMKQIIEDIGKTNYKELKIVVSDLGRVKVLQSLNQPKN